MRHSRPASIPRHRTRRTEEPMESYRNQILTMLDSIQDAKLMRLIYEVVKAILMNR